MGTCSASVRRPEAERLQVADVLKAALDGSRRPHLPAHHWKTLNALLGCHTPALGGHVYRCEACGGDHFVAHGCRNRHCPSCQRTHAEEWLQKQEASLLPIAYFHVVFTLPHALNGLIGQNQRALYKLLFDCASSTLLAFGEGKLKAQIGVSAVLHTWSQTLLDHYHLHCVVTGGGLCLKTNRWQSSSERYLFPVRALSKMFRGRFRAGLKSLYEAGKLGFHGALEALSQRAPFEELLRDAFALPWVVYSKKPFAGPRAVLAYLSRYTHRVAIGNGRLQAMDEGANSVTFSYKDYADGGRRKRMELPLGEFLRRFCLHILPEGFVKIRHYGLLGNRQRSAKIAAAREQLARQGNRGAVLAGSAPEAKPAVALACPHCGSEKLRLIERRGRGQAGPQRIDSS